ncbi:MAG: BrnT family toxin [Nitrospirae bacterium]|nr:BrnT family toxin [Nitrospirota bacterium]
MRYYFDWDPDKAETNLRKHKLSFEQASTVFLDPLALTIFDEEHSEDQDRWVTMGSDNNDALLVVVHTYQHIEEHAIKVRVISARKATRTEARQYKEAGK